MRRAVLVTGGASFLGRRLAERLVLDGREIVLLDVAVEPPWVAGMRGVTYVSADVCDVDAVGLAVRAADSVVHAAFVPPERDMALIERVNVAGTRTVMEAAVAARRPVVMVSSTIVERVLRPHPALRSAPQSRLFRYARTRAAAEQLALGMGAANDVPVSAVRPKTFLGPRAVGAFAVLFEHVRLGRDVPLLGPGTHRYQLLHVDDFAGLCAALLDRPVAGVVGAGAEAVGSVRSDLLGLIDHAGTGSRLRTIPARFARAALGLVDVVGLSPPSEWHQCAARGEDSVIDLAAARSSGWTPQHSNGEALVDAYTWYAHEARAGVRPNHPVPRTHRVLARLLSMFPVPAEDPQSPDNARR